MNISLTPELERYIHDKVSTGLYTTASEVIRESLRMMHAHDEVQAHRINELNQAISIGMKQLSNGEKISADKSYEKLKDKINKIAKKNK